MFKHLREFMQRFGTTHGESTAKLDHCWSLSARLASVPDFYTMIVPTDLADLVREAKQLHPEVAYHASRRDLAVKRWIERARTVQKQP